MAIFYSVVEDDPLDSGENSRVIDGLANCTIEGQDGRHRRMTFLGHMAWCDRCKSAGEIAAAAGCLDNRRMFDATLGRYQALGGDKVSDEATRTHLLTGLAAVNRILRGLGPKNFIRSSDDGDRAIGCLPNVTNRVQEAAHVCAPDTATHTISISEKFCLMRDWSAYADSKISTLIHEVTHFQDTMATIDQKYTIVPQLKDWGQAHPDLAISNADSVAGYVIYGD